MTVVQRIETHLRARFAGEGTGHDWHHIDRVRKLALRLAEVEDVDLEVVELAALLHDVADWKFHGGDETKGPAEAERLLRKEGAAAPLVAAVCEIVGDVSFKGAGVATPMRSIEGKVVQDADRLDALGAIGIARCFAYGAVKGQPLHDPATAPAYHADFAAYKSARGTSLNHFHEKLLLLKDRMNTAAGRAIAEGRHAFMEKFVAQFIAEWDGKR